MPNTVISPDYHEDGAPRASSNVKEYEAECNTANSRTGSIAVVMGAEANMKIRQKSK